MQPKNPLDGVWRNQTPSADAAPQAIGATTSTNSPPIEPELLNDEQAARLCGTSLRSFKSMQTEPWFPAPVILSARQKRHIRGELLTAIASRAPRRESVVEPAHLQAARDRKRGAA